MDLHIVEIADLFHGMIENEPLYEIEILVDALDECHDDEVRDTVRRFEDSVQISRTCNAALRICWSSRFYPHISLRSTDGLELFLKSNNATDIYRVVEREFPVGSDNRLRNIRSDLLKKAQDIFLWAVLTAKTLAKQPMQARVQKSLSCCCRIFHRISMLYLRGRLQNLKQQTKSEASLSYLHNGYYAQGVLLPLRSSILH